MAEEREAESNDARDQERRVALATAQAQALAARQNSPQLTAPAVNKASTAAPNQSQPDSSTDDERMVLLEKVRQQARNLINRGRLLRATGLSTKTTGQAAEKTAQISRIPGRVLTTIGAGLDASGVGAVFGVVLQAIGYTIIGFTHVAEKSAMILTEFGQIQMTAGEKMYTAGQIIEKSGGQKIPPIPSEPIKRPWELLTAGLKRKHNLVKTTFWLGIKAVAILIIAAISLVLILKGICSVSPIPDVICEKL